MCQFFIRHIVSSIFFRTCFSFVGSDLANLANVAATLAVKQEKSEITMEMFREAMLTVKYGPQVLQSFIRTFRDTSQYYLIGNRYKLFLPHYGVVFVCTELSNFSGFFHIGGCLKTIL